MRPVCLTGPLAWPPLLKLIAGADVAQAGVAATVPGVAVRAGGAFALASAEQDAAAGGLLLDAPGREVADRLHYVAVATGHFPETREVSGPDGNLQATVFLSRDEAAAAADWTLSGWRARWGDVALNAAAEITGYFGSEDATSLPPRMPMILARAEARRAAAAHPAPATLRSPVTADRVELAATETKHAGFFVTRAYELRHPAFDGGMSPRVRREIFIATDAALVLPYDPARDRVMLIEQFRPGPYGRGDPRPWVLEPVAGRVDGGESPEACAYRECDEEAGLKLSGLEHISSHYCSPGAVTEFFHCYLGLCDLPDLNTGRGGLDDEHEDIRTHVLPFADALALCRTGEANIGPLVLMLFWLAGERDRLRARA